MFKWSFIILWFFSPFASLEARRPAVEPFFEIAKDHPSTGHEKTFNFSSKSSTIMARAEPIPDWVYYAVIFLVTVTLPLALRSFMITQYELEFSSKKKTLKPESTIGDSEKPIPFKKAS